MQGSRLFEVLGRPTGIPKGLKKRKFQRGGGGVAILEFGGQGLGGDEHFGISEGKGGQNTHATRGRVWIFSGITQCIKSWSSTLIVM